MKTFDSKIKHKLKYEDEFDEVVFATQSKNPFLRAFVKERHNFIANLVKEKKPKIALDVGCGDGYFLSILNKKQIAKTYGIDVSPKRVKQARKNTKNSIIKHADARKIPFKNKYFDAVVMTDVIEHIPNYMDALTEISRVLKKNGYLYITAPFENRLKAVMFLTGRWYKTYHVNFFEPETLAADLKKVGMKMIDFWTFPLILPRILCYNFLILAKKIH